MRTCPKCKKELVADDGYCAGWCREIVMEPLNVKATPAVAGAAICSAETIAEAILGRWTLCQALGDNGEYYPCPGDEDEQLAELTIIIEDALKPKATPPNDQAQRLATTASVERNGDKQK